MNTTKTQAIISVTGPMKHKILSRYIRKQGADRHLLLSAGDPIEWILLVDISEYLGMTISYENLNFRQ